MIKVRMMGWAVKVARMCEKVTAWKEGVEKPEKKR